MSWLRVILIRLLGWVAKRFFDFALLLRLFSLVLERKAARSSGPAAEAAGDAVQQSRIDDGIAWLDFCDTLRGLVEFVVQSWAPAPPPPPLVPEVSAGFSATVSTTESTAVRLDELDRREGLRYLTRILRGGLEAFMDCWDPAWPVLRPLPYNVKLGADNPDNLYMYGTVSGSFQYRLHGNRGSVTYLSFGCYSGSRPGAGSSRPAHLDSSRLVTRPDGSFEIFLTSQPRGDNWLPLAPDASRVVVRQTFLDRAKEVPAQVNIERLPVAAAAVAGPGAAARSVGASGAASGILVDAAGREVKAPLSAGQVAAGLAGAAVFVAGSVRQFQAWSRSFAARPNMLPTLPHDVYMTAWADPAIHFFHGYWRLGPGEALLIQVTPPDCLYWNFQLDNWWMESLDYVAHPETTTNKATASYMPDGSICLVVAHTDPRVIPPPAGAATTAGGSDGAGASTGASYHGGHEVRKTEGQEKGQSYCCSLEALLPPRLLAGVTWISTAHHTHGTMGRRWVLARSHPVPRCRVVRLGRSLAEAIVR